MAQGLIAAIALALALALPAQAEVLPEIRPPKWSDLNVQQKQVLTPLQSEWDSLADAHRKKWLGIANRYPRMSAEEQGRVQIRMRQWAELTPEQRSNARERYRRLQNIPPEKREALKKKWQEYEKLPEAEKKRLEDNRSPRAPGRGAPVRRNSANAETPIRAGTTVPLPPSTGLPQSPAVPAPALPTPLPAGPATPAATGAGPLPAQRPAGGSPVPDSHP
jgi:hypothetical protein